MLHCTQGVARMPAGLGFYGEAGETEDRCLRGLIIRDILVLKDCSCLCMRIEYRRASEKGYYILVVSLSQLDGGP